MFKLYKADHIHTGGRRAIPSSRGFTAADIIALREIHAAAVARQIWGRGQFVSNEFAHYLAVWHPAAGAGDPPALAVARFTRTGTYALTIGTTVVASGRSLREVLPALPFGVERSDRRSSTLEAAD